MVATSPVGNQPRPCSSGTSGSPPSPLKYSLTTHGPLTSRSPEVLPSQGSSLPSPSTIFMSTPKIARPCFMRIAVCCSGDCVEVLVLQRAQRAQRRHLGHAPGMQHLDAVLLLEGVDHGRRAGRAADHGALQGRELQVVGLHVAQHHLPDGGHAGREGDPLGLDQFEDRLAVERRAGKHQLAPVSAAEYGMPQALTWNIGTTGSTESRADRSHHVRQRGGVGMQQRGAVAVERSLRVARGAARVAHARRRVLVEAGPVVAVGLCGPIQAS